MRTDIDPNLTDEFGRTNKEHMEQGLSARDKDGKPIELHHIGQKNNGGLAELTEEEHRGKENTKILHDTSKESEINRGEFRTTRQEY